jgi:glycosyltransferase involved in cell wall biosynthesis
VRIGFFATTFSPEQTITADVIQRVQNLKKSKFIEELFCIGLHDKSSIGKDSQICFGIDSKHKTRFSSLLLLYQIILKLKFIHKIDYLYFYMTPTVLPFVYPIAKLLRIKVVVWFCHTQYSRWNKFALTYCTDIWFNSNDSMTTFSVPHLYFVGQGVDSECFYPKEIKKIYDLIIVGRITPVKKIEHVIKYVALCNTKYNKQYTLAICGGPYIKSDESYYSELKKLVIDNNLSSQIFFLGEVARDALCDLLNQSKLNIFPQPGGIGKCVLEGIACGVPFIVNEPKAASLYGEELKGDLILNGDEIKVVAKIHEILSLSDSEYNVLRAKMVQKFKDSFSMEALYLRISTIMFEKLKD